MRLLSGTFDATFHGQTTRCPVSAVIDGEGNVEVAVATPFGMRRVNGKLDGTGHLTSAYTFAFDYETGEVTRFELVVEGGSAKSAAFGFEGTVAGTGLNGHWLVTEFAPAADEVDDADQALRFGGLVPVEVTPAPIRIDVDQE